MMRSDTSAPRRVPALHQADVAVRRNFATRQLLRAVGITQRAPVFRSAPAWWDEDGFLVAGAPAAVWGSMIWGEDVWGGSGAGGLVDAPLTDGPWARQGGMWVAIPSGGLDDAPLTDGPWARQGGIWVPIPEGGWAGIPEAPADGRTYTRSGLSVTGDVWGTMIWGSDNWAATDGMWVALPDFIEDAPSTGGPWAREAGDWVPVASVTIGNVDGGSF